MAVHFEGMGRNMMFKKLTLRVDLNLNANSAGNHQYNPRTILLKYQ